MDKIDVNIIRELSQNADVTATELSRKLHFSVPAVNKRIRSMKKEGIIKNFTIITDNKKVGKPIVAFVLIVLKSVEHTETFFEYVGSDLDILECYAITGEYDCLLKVCAASVEDLDKKLLMLKTHNGVMKSYTMLSLTTHKYAPTVLAENE
ncbi:MAG: Lrp/AsnC family transcriptional regulator [Ruminococcaceae bacterium]|nr:Lrp/AsnC family transcriptional regulator [Oscillospiraceae bacterium]